MPIFFFDIECGGASRGRNATELADEAAAWDKAVEIADAYLRDPASRADDVVRITVSDQHGAVTGTVRSELV